MISLFHGEDTYDSYSKAFAFSSSVAKKHGVNLTILNVDEISSISEFMQHIEGIGLFAETSVIFAKRLFKNKMIADHFTEIYSTLDYIEIIVWEDSKVPSNRKLYKLLASDKTIHYSKQLKPNELLQWAITEIKKREIPLQNNMASRIIELVGDNKWIIASELDKLQLLTKTTMDYDIDTVVVSSKDYDIWRFIEYIGKRDNICASHELETILRQADSQYVISMLRRELFIMTLAYQTHQNDPALKTLQIHPFSFQKAQRAIRKFSWSDLQNLSKKLLALDLSIKQGEIDGALGLTLFLQLV